MKTQVPEVECPNCHAPEEPEIEVTEKVFRVWQWRRGLPGIETFIVQAFTEAKAISYALEVLLADDETVDVRNISAEELTETTILI